MTSWDGARVAFSSSLSLRSDAAHAWPKLFEADAGGIRLVEERFAVSPPAPLPAMEAFYEMVSRDQSSDGAVQALNTSRPCLGGSRCVFVERAMGELRAPGFTEPYLRGGTMRLSADGHYGFSFWSTAPVNLTAIVDVASSTVTALTPVRGDVAPAGRRVIANDGTAVYVDVYQEGSLMVATRDGGLTVAKASMPAASAIVEASGRYVVYVGAEAPHRLMLYELADGWELPLVEAEEGCSLPTLSDDGRQMLFLSAANWEAANDQRRVQAWLFDLYTGRLRQLTRDLADVTDATLSGDGKVVWAATMAGRLLQIETGSATVTEVTGRTAALDYENASCARGSQCVVSGRGLASGVADAPAELPMALGGIEVKLDGVAVPVVSVAPDEIRFVVPWETAAGPYRLEVTAGDSAFQQKNEMTLRVTDGEVALYEAAPGEIYALHEDYRGPVTRRDPALAGEVVHVLASGLGPVSPAWDVRRAAPGEPRSMTVTPMAWTVRDGAGAAAAAEVLYSGLAPGRYGVYQVDIRVPAGLGGAELTISVGEVAGRLAARAGLVSGAR